MINDLTGKAFVFGLLVVLVVGGTIGCDSDLLGGESASPEEVLEAFYQAMYVDDFDEMRALSTGDALAVISLGEAFSSEMSESTVDYEVNSTDYVGDDEVVFEVTTVYSDGDEDEGTVTMTKSNGGWLISTLQ